jgi:hypothetical protein
MKVIWKNVHSPYNALSTRQLLYHCSRAKRLIAEQFVIRDWHARPSSKSSEYSLLCSFYASAPECVCVRVCVCARVCVCVCVCVVYVRVNVCISASATFI